MSQYISRYVDIYTYAFDAKILDRNRENDEVKRGKYFFVLNPIHALQKKKIIK